MEGSPEPAGQDSEFFRFASLVTDTKVSLQDTDADHARFEPPAYPAETSLIATSSRFGYVVAATLKGFVYTSTKTLRTTILALPKTTTGKLTEAIHVPVTQGPVTQIRLSAQDSHILLAVGGNHLLVYKAKDIVDQKENAVPTYTYTLDDAILDLRPNPEALPNLLAVRLKNNQCHIFSWFDGKTVATIPGATTALCWSPKGKQLVCGRPDGQLEVFDAQAARKDVIDLPEQMKAGYEDEAVNRFVQGVLWIENNQFLAIYARPRVSADDEHIHTGYIIDRKSQATQTLQYILLDEIVPVFGADDRGGYMYMEIIRDFSKEMPHVILIANTAATEVSVVGQDEQGQWAAWILPETGMLPLPLSTETNMDTYPMGLALDLTADEPLPPHESSDSNEPVKPMPIVYYINDEGDIGAYRCYNDAIALRGEGFAGMVSPQDVHTAPDLPQAPAPTTTPVTPRAPATGATTGAGAAGAAAATATMMQTPGAAPASGFAALGQQSTSSFGDLLSGASTQQQPPSSVPLLGGGPRKPISFGALGAAGKPPNTGMAPALAAKPTTEPPKFGSTSFGFGSPAPAATPASSFGGFGLNAKAASEVKKEEEAKPAPTGFGALKPSAEAKSVFGAAAPAATTQETKPAFGTTTSFGAAAAAAAPPAAKTEAKPVFGSTTGFGAQASTQAPAFGATSFGKPAETKPTFGATSFGKPAETKPTFGATSFGQPAETKPTFGATSFGKPAETKPALGAFGTAIKAEENKENEENKAVADTTSKLGGFGLGAPADDTKAPTSSLGGFGTAKPAETKPSFEVKKETDTSTDTANKLGSFSFGGAEKKEAPKTTFSGFGSAATSTAPTTTTTAAPSTGFTGFGAAATAPKPASAGFSFGSPAAASKPPTTGGLGSGTPSPKPSSPAAQPQQPSPQQQQQQTQTLPKPSAGFGFGSATATSPSVSTATASPSLKAPTASSPLASKPVATPAPETAASTEPRYSASGTGLTQPTTSDGMARQFEETIIRVDDEFVKIRQRQQKVAEMIKQQEKSQAQQKGMSSLSQTKTWRVGDAADLVKLTEQMQLASRGAQPQIEHFSKTVEYLRDDLMKLKEKMDTMKALAEKEGDPELKARLAKLPLDEDTLEKWHRAESSVIGQGQMLESVEHKVQTMRHGNVPTGDSPSTFSVYRTLRYIEQHMQMVEARLQTMEEELSKVRFQQAHDRVARLAHTFSANFNLDDEDVPKPEKKSAPRTVAHDAVLRQATEYLRQENFNTAFGAAMRQQRRSKC